MTDRGAAGCRRAGRWPPAARASYANPSGVVGANEATNTALLVRSTRRSLSRRAPSQVHASLAAPKRDHRHDHLHDERRGGEALRPAATAPRRKSEPEGSHCRQSRNERASGLGRPRARSGRSGAALVVVYGHHVDLARDQADAQLNVVACSEVPDEARVIGSKPVVREVDPSRALGSCQSYVHLASA